MTKRNDTYTEYSTYLRGPGKRCGKCGVFRSIDCFGRNKRMLDGFSNACRKCLNIQARENAAKRRAEINEAARRNYRANKELYKATKKAWYARNKARLVAYHKERRVNQWADRIYARSKEERAKRIVYQYYRKTGERVPVEHVLGLRRYYRIWLAWHKSGYKSSLAPTLYRVDGQPLVMRMAEMRGRMVNDRRRNA